MTKTGRAVPRMAVPLIVLLMLLCACTLEQRYGPYSGFLLGAYPDPGKRPTLAQELGFSKKAVVVIVHADDIAMHRDQTDGSFEAMRQGMVKSGSVMVPCPDFERVAGIWAENPDLDLGIHLTLNSDWGEKYGWKGVLPQSQVPSLYDSNGLLWRKPRQLMANMDVEDALRELEAQILKTLKAGLNPTHIDGHYGNYYLSTELAEGVSKLSKKYNLPMKPPTPLREKMRRQGHVFPDTLWMFLILYGEGLQPDIRKKVYDHWLRSLKPGVHEMVIHASLMSEDWADTLGRPNSYLRLGDHAYWTSSATKDLAHELGIVFIGYRELQKLQARKWGLATDGVQFEE